MISKVKSYVGLEEEEKSELEKFQEEICPSLSYEQRLYGFIGCFVTGWIISLLSCFALVHIKDQPGKFAVLYTFGNVVALCSTCFLWGPCSQLKSMMKSHRLIASILYLVSMVATLVCAFTGQKVILIVLCIFVQFFALLWYCLSYIPYARQMVKACIGF